MEILEILRESLESGRPVALCTVVHTVGSVPRHAGTKMLVFADGQIRGTVGGGEVEERVRAEALESLVDGETRFLTYDMVDVARGDAGVCGGSVSVYVEPYLQPPTVVVVGAGHVGRSVAHLASWLGYRVVVSDDRKSLCTPELVPDADGYLPMPMSRIPEEIRIDARTFFVLVTRGVEVDIEGLPALLETQPAYIGLIGSRKRWAHCREKLREAGVSEEAIRMIKSPIGLDIRAETPDEIALSIMAEITARHHAGKGTGYSYQSHGD